MSNPVLEFEKKFSSKLGTEYAIAVNSGTSALHAALEAVEVRYGEVIMPALCPGLVAFAIIYAGGWPIFADVDPQTQLVTHETISKAIGSRTKAVIAVGLHGLPVDIDPIRRLCHPRGIKVIEDNAQCLFGRYKDVYAGAKADIACFSFEKKKHLTTGSEGGMIVTNEAVLAGRARKFAGLGYSHLDATINSTRVPDVRPGYARFDTIGLNYRMSEVQAEIGLQKLPNALDAVWIRQEIGYLYQHALNCQLQPHDYDAENTFYSAAWPSPFWGDRWLKFYEEFESVGGDGFYAAPQIPYNEPALTDYRGLIEHPVAKGLQSRLICFKTHYTLQEASKQIDILEKMLHGTLPVKV